LLGQRTPAETARVEPSLRLSAAAAAQNLSAEEERLEPGYRSSMRGDGNLIERLQWSLKTRR
jgi:hypothetical protein